MQKDVKNETSDSKIENSEVAGTVYGNVSTGSTVYGEIKFNSARGHGFAAERANHLYDKLSGKNATLVGEEIDDKTGRIVKNGADRVVDGLKIQTKYCKTGSKCTRVL